MKALGKKEIPVEKSSCYFELFINISIYEADLFIYLGLEQVDLLKLYSEFLKMKKGQKGNQTKQNYFR